MDLKTRNKAIDLMWLKDYLRVGKEREPWAYVADALIARAVVVTDRIVEDGAKGNIFLQQWAVNTSRAGKLPEDLRRMMKVSEKYGVRAESANPARTLWEAMLIWYHIGWSEGRRVANTVAAKCLRRNHKVSTMMDMSRVARRARSEQLQAKWHEDDEEWADGLTLMDGQRRMNAMAEAREECVVFDPSITDNCMADLFRVFVEEDEVDWERRTQRPPKSYQVDEEAVEVYTDSLADPNGCTTARVGSGVWFGHTDRRNKAVRAPEGATTNQVAELHAISVAADLAPPFAPMHIVTDSKYGIDGLTKHLEGWENQGWIGVRNSDYFKDAAVRLHARSAVTTFRWVKGHTGIDGNEEADRLASEGAMGDNRAEMELVQLRYLKRGASMEPVQLRYLKRGASMEELMQSIAYWGIREWSRTEQRKVTRLTVERVQATLEHETGRAPTEGMLWKAIRQMTCSRKMRDFFSEMMHDTICVGRYWEYIPGYENGATCVVCGVVELMEHILTECDAPGQGEVWEEVRKVLSRRGMEPVPVMFGTVLGCMSLDMEAVVEKPMKETNRLIGIVMSEVAHLIWRIWCERVIQNEGDEDK